MSLYIIAALVMAVLGAVGLAFYLGRGGGRAEERAETLEGSNEVKDRQLDAAARRPRSRRELADRVRDPDS